MPKKYPQHDLRQLVIRLVERGNAHLDFDAAVAMVPAASRGKRPKGWPLDRDPLIPETSVPGIFAAGDVRYGTNHRVASAAGEGGIAIAAIQSYLSTQ